MNILVTRPEDDAAPLAEALRARGHRPILAPLLSIAMRDDNGLSLDGVQALLITSANGVRALVHQNPNGLFTLPVFAVGDASARAARAAGFAKVTSADGDVDGLATLVTRTLAADGGALLHAAGSTVAGDLGGALERAGFRYRRAVLYAAQPAQKLPQALVDGVESAGIDGVMFFSPRTARIFANLVALAGLADRWGQTTAFCLSPAVADRLEGVKFGTLRVAAHPTQDALLDAIDNTN